MCRNRASEIGRYNEELVKADVMQAGDGLHPSAKGTPELREQEERLRAQVAAQAKPK